MADKTKQPTVSDADDQGNEVPNTSGDGEGAEQPPNDKPTGITLIFKDVHGAEISFKLKGTTKMKKAMVRSITSPLFSAYRLLIFVAGCLRHSQ